MQLVSSTEPLTIWSIGKPSAKDGSRFARVHVSDTDPANIHRQGDRTGFYWVDVGQLVADDAVLPQLPTALPPGPEALPHGHQLSAADAARAAAAVDRGYWSAGELELRRAVLNERKCLACISSYEMQVLGSYDIDPAEALAMMRAEQTDRRAVIEELKQYDPSKVGHLMHALCSTLLCSIHSTLLYASFYSTLLYSTLPFSSPRNMVMQQA